MNSYVVLMLSAACLFAGVFLWRKGNHLLKNGRKAEAVIFTNNFEASDDGGGVYFPVIRFLTDKQEWITQQLRVGTSSKKPEGTKLQVIYDPDDPTDFQINSIFLLEILPRLFTAVGVMG